VKRICVGGKLRSSGSEPGIVVGIAAPVIICGVCRLVRRLIPE
jgi:hypothetical protein